MALYYYSKYNATATSTYSNPDASFSFYSTAPNFQSGYDDYGWNSTDGFDPTGTYLTELTPAATTTLTFSWGGAELREYVNYPAGNVDIYRKRCTESTTYSQGSLLQSGIVAEDGTYPDDGYQASYWWVKNTAVPSSSGFLALF